MPIKIILVAILCHLAAGHALTCQRETVWQGDPEQADEVCEIARDVILKWKSASTFAGNDWAVLAYSCKVGSSLT